MVDAEDDEEVDASREFIKDVLKKCGNVIVILSSRVLPPDRNTVKTAMLNLMEESAGVEIILGFERDGGKSVADLKNEVRIAISEKILKTPTLSVTDCLSLAKKNGLQFISDEMHPLVRKGKKNMLRMFFNT